MNGYDDNRPAIYLAGKISQNGWRSHLVDCRGLTHPDETRALFDENYHVKHDGFIYGGPFFISCEHGCAHGPNSHGVAATGDSPCLFGVPEQQRRVYEINKKRLLRADYIFAHIETADCYGTFVELGMAAAQGKPIFIAWHGDVPEQVRKDLWYPEMTANDGSTVVRGRLQLIAAWRKFLLKHEIRQAQPFHPHGSYNVHAL
jgi:nucleoside 2-deoxyribosyltransferase